MKNPPLLESSDYLDEHVSNIGGEDHKEYAGNDRIDCLDGIFGERAGGEGGEGACGEFLGVDILVIPGASDNAERVAGIIGHPVVCGIAAVVLGVIEQEVDGDEDAGSVVAHHQHVAEQHHQGEDDPCRRLVLQGVYYLVLVFEFLYPDEPARDELQEVQIEVHLDQGNHIDHKYYKVHMELALQVVRYYFSLVVDHPPPPERVEPSKEAEEDVHCEVDRDHYEEDALHCREGELFVEEVRAECQVQRNLQLYDVEHYQEDHIPNEGEDREGIDIQPAVKALSLFLRVLLLSLLPAQQPQNLFLNVRGDL